MKIFLLLFFLFFVFQIKSDKTDTRTRTNTKTSVVDDYIKLNNPNIRVHLLPHSHWDVGWLNTIDEYYSDQVSLVINNIIKNNEKNLNLRFVFSEMFEEI